MWNRMAGVKSRVHEWKEDCFALPIVVGTVTKLSMIHVTNQ
jgi:hypothetical protein